MTITETRATFSEPPGPVTPQRVGRILWRRKLVCLVFAIIVMAAGGAAVLSRPVVYQSTSSVALLPQASNPGILPNYPNLIISLIPTYVQLVSSPILLNQVAASVPFHTTGQALASDVHAESMSSAAVISIVARSTNPLQARQIATQTTRAFIRQLHGNKVVIPKVYGAPTAATPAGRTKLLLGVVAVLAILIGLAAGLIWDRLRPAEAEPDMPFSRQPAT